MSNCKKEKYHEKYLKYKNKYLNFKQAGGLIGKNKDQQIIESIGFEFESLYLQPFVFIKNNENYFSDERYANEFYKKNSLDKLYAKQNIEVVNNIKENFLMNVSSEYAREKPVFEICKNIKKNDELFKLNYPSTDFLNKFYLKNISDNTVIEQVTNIEKHRDLDDKEDGDEWLNICYKSNTEFTFTYAKINKSDNTIYEHFHKSIHYLHNYFTNYCESSSCSFNLVVYDKINKRKKIDDVIIDKTTFFKQKFTTGNRLAYMIINNKELFDEEKNENYFPTINDIKWDMHMTLGVKLENVGKLLKYLSFYEESKLTNIIVIDSIHEAEILIEVLKLYVKLTSKTHIFNNDIIYSQLKGFFTLISYYCNAFTLNVSLDNTHEFNKYGYSFMLRNRFENFIDYFETNFHESLINILINFFNVLINKSNQLVPYIEDKKIKFSFEQIINKYKCKIIPSKRAMCEFKKIIRQNLATEDYIAFINQISNLLTNILYLLKDNNLLLYDILIFSTTEIKMDKDIIFIEYRGFRIDNFGNNIYTLEKYTEIADKFLIKEDEPLPNNKEILMKSKYITKIKKPKSLEYIFMLDNKIYKRKKITDNKYINLFLV